MRFSNGQEATREQPSFFIGTQDRHEGDPHIVADPFLPRSAKPLPVPVSQGRRHDQVECDADGGRLCMAEEILGDRVPETDRSCPVHQHDGGSVHPFIMSTTMPKGQEVGEIDGVRPFGRR